MRINFGGVPDGTGYRPLEDGQYLCRVADVKTGYQTGKGDDRWNLELEITSGLHAGRRIFDSLIFSEAALPRVKYVCRRLGLDVSGELDLTPELLIGRLVYVTTYQDTYTTREGQKRVGNKVHWDGYEEAEGVAAESLQAEPESVIDDTPF